MIEILDWDFLRRIGSVTSQYQMSISPVGPVSLSCMHLHMYSLVCTVGSRVYSVEYSVRDSLANPAH